MGNTLDSYCRACGKNTYFVYDGESWECGSCGSYDTNSSSSDSDPYNWDDGDD